MIIEVTQSNIDEANRLRHGAKTYPESFPNYALSKTCPVSLAILREFPECVVTSSLASINVDFAEYRVSKAVYEFILKYDSEREVKPFRFNLIRKGV